MDMVIGVDIAAAIGTIGGGTTTVGTGAANTMVTETATDKWRSLALRISF